MNILDLQKDIHRVAIEHGWWQDERPFGELISLCHSEASELLEAYRKRDEANEAEELADIKIRVHDMLEGMREGMVDFNMGDSFPEKIAAIHRLLSRALSYGNSTAGMQALYLVLDTIDDMAAERGFDIDAEVLTKHEKNKSRPYRHGNKRC